jgi:hypothetical protein
LIVWFIFYPILFYLECIEWNNSTALY